MKYLSKTFFYTQLFLLLANTTVAEGIRDIKPPIYFKANYFFLFLTGGLIIVAALILTIKFFSKKEGAEAASAKMAPYEIAYQALERLKAKNLTAAGKIKEYYFELSYIVRTYIENSFGIRSPEMTTEEFLLSLRNSDTLTGVHKNLLKEFLSLCDIVKFAKYSPTQKESDEAFVSARKFIEETKETEELKEELEKG